MRKGLFLAFCALISAAPARAVGGIQDRLSRYFGGWYAMCPGTQISVSAVPEIAVPGYEAYRVERRCDAKNRNEMSIALVDTPRDEVFIGEVLYSEERRNKAFVPSSDIPVIEAALRDTFGLAVSVRLGAGSRGSLIAIQVSLRQAPNASASLSGFVSQDGAGLLLGEFHPLGTPPEAWRENVLSESAGIQTGKGNFAVTAFIDFQCEKCRVRAPQVRDFVSSRGGTLEIRFLPLVKIHNWAFAAAESGRPWAASLPRSTRGTRRRSFLGPDR